jgi:hypothetical protein
MGHVQTLFTQVAPGPQMFPQAPQLLASLVSFTHPMPVPQYVSFAGHWQLKPPGACAFAEQTEPGPHWFPQVPQCWFVLFAVHMPPHAI